MARMDGTVLHHKNESFRLSSCSRAMIDLLPCFPEMHQCQQSSVWPLLAVLVLERICEFVLRLDKLATTSFGLTVSFLA